MLSHKQPQNNVKKTEVIQCIFPSDNGVKLELSNRMKTGLHKYVEIKQDILHQPMGQRGDHKGK